MQRTRRISTSSSDGLTQLSPYRRWTQRLSDNPFTREWIRVEGNATQGVPEDKPVAIRSEAFEERTGVSVVGRLADRALA